VRPAGEAKGQDGQASAMFPELSRKSESIPMALNAAAHAARGMPIFSMRTRSGFIRFISRAPGPYRAGLRGTRLCARHPLRAPCGSGAARSRSRP